MSKGGKLRVAGNSSPFSFDTTKLHFHCILTKFVYRLTKIACLHTMYSIYNTYITKKGTMKYRHIKAHKYALKTFLRHRKQKIGGGVVILLSLILLGALMGLVGSQDDTACLIAKICSF